VNMDLASTPGPISIVISPLQKLHSVCPDEIHEAVLLGDAARPHASSQVFQRLGFADAGEGIAQHGTHQLQQAPGGALVGCDPVLQVIQKLWMADRFPLRAHASIQASSSSMGCAGRVSAWARSRAARRRAALRGERRRCAVSSSPSSSSAATRATSPPCRRRTITTSRSSTTRSIRALSWSRAAV
jgi:hypothetical protein